METRAHYVVIGFFTVLLASSGLLFGLWLAKAGDHQDYRFYDIVFREAVSGLSIGNAVEYSGIRVGEVRKLSLDPQDPRQVWARVRVTADTPIKEDTQARLALANITGATNIQLANGSPASPPLRSDAQHIPVIVAEPSPFARLKVNSEEMLTSITALVDHAKLLLSAENIEHISALLQNLETASAAIADQKEDIRQGLHDLAATGRQANQAAQQAEQLVQHLNRLLENHGENLFGNADQAMADMQHITGRLDRLLDAKTPALESGLDGLAELGPAIREFRLTVAVVRDIARQLEENPAGYLLGRDQVKEFKP